MLELSALTVITILYIVPLNIFLYYLSQQTVISIINLQSNVGMIIKKIPILASIIQSSISTGAAFFYILYVVLIFAAVYLLFKFVVIKGIYVYFDREVDIDHLLSTYSRGQRNINIAGNISVTVLLILYLIFKVFDIKSAVLGILCLMFVFKKIKLRQKRKPAPQQVTADEQAQVTEEENNNKVKFEWFYNTDSLGLQKPTRFSASIFINMDRYKEYQNKEHSDNSSAVLRKYVLDGICPEIVDLASQIKKQCIEKGFTTFHQASAVMAFQQSLRYVYDIDSKGIEEYVRYPLETLADREGDCDCHGICSAAILYSIGYDVVLLRILYADSNEGHLAIAVEGADGIPGNFYELGGRRYYYCEVTPSSEGKMNFKVGEMPDMPGANVTVIPVKEIVNTL